MSVTRGWIMVAIQPEGDSLPGLMESPETSRRTIQINKSCGTITLSNPHGVSQDDSKTLTRIKKNSVIQTLLILVRTIALVDFCSTLLVEFAERTLSNDSTCHDKDMHPVSLWISANRHQISTVSNTFSIVFSFFWFIDAIVKAAVKRRRADRLWNLLSPSKQHRQRDKAKRRYYRTIVLQFLLLPVGFYLFVGFLFRFAVGMEKENNKEAVDGLLSSEGTLTERTDLCLLVGVLRFTASHFKHRMGVAFEAGLKTVKWKSVRKLFKSAIRRPRTFRRRVLKFLTYLRWIQYLLPLFAAGNKLRENVVDFVKKYKQRLASMHAQGVRRRRWSHLTLEQQQHVAAALLQARFRSRRTRKLVQVLKKLKAEQEWRAITTFQKIARGMLERARLRILKKRLELQRLQEQEEHSLSLEDQRRLHELESELKREAEALLNRKLLLRPNTTFAVVWKLLFLLCILFEIGQLVYKPSLERYREKSSKKPMGIGKILELKLVPTPMEEWEICQELPMTADESGFWFSSFMRNHTKPITRIPPWYCSYKTAHSMFSNVIRFAVTETLVIAGIVCYLDVFVTFFTGELDPETGTLGPKPSFTRYLLPGLLLQLVVNPQMVRTSGFFIATLKWIGHVGPVRVWRWTATLFYPFLRAVALWITRRIWVPLVDEQNRKRHSAWEA